ncbi:MAG: hypothetical protein K9G60_10495, partial [Pseudolabrys sp.]|nr:hypothetical protein [Pseudolabrys sp.]
MDFKRLTARRPAYVAAAKVFAGAVACGILAGMMVLTSAPPARTGGQFSFDRALLRGTPPLR